MDYPWDLESNSLLFRKMQTDQRITRDSFSTTVWWIKRDFRVTDNHCLYLAVHSSKEVIPFFCWEPHVLEAGDYGVFHLQAQWQALRGLSASLHRRGSGLYECSGMVVEQLEALYQKHPFQCLRSYQETGNTVTYQRDLAVRAWCRSRGVAWKESIGSTVVRGMNAEQKRKVLGKGPRGRLEVLPVPNHLSPPKSIDRFSDPLEWKDLCARFNKFRGSPLCSSLQTVNERSAWQTLDSFLEERGLAYSGGISSPNTAFSAGSRLSPHLAWGTISSGSVFLALDQRRDELSACPNPGAWKRSLRAFESRLHWRDHFIQRLEGFPAMEFSSINPVYNSIEYRDDSNDLACWIAGRTGYPLIDACMRCLQHTGFLNFRMRAMVVSFACFGLHLSWKTIHGPLARLFFDYEPGIHLSQLQMQAGITGINAIRVYSPSKQLLDHDPDCHFVKKWVPELQSYTAVEIAHAEELNLRGYTAPWVMLKEQAKKMKDQIFSIRKSMEGRSSSQQMLQKHGSTKRRNPKKKTKKKEEQMALFKD